MIAPASGPARPAAGEPRILPAITPALPPPNECPSCPAIAPGDAVTCPRCGVALGTTAVPALDDAALRTLALPAWRLVRSLATTRGIPPQETS